MANRAELMKDLTRWRQKLVEYEEGQKLAKDEIGKIISQLKEIDTPKGNRYRNSQNI